MNSINTNMSALQAQNNMREQNDAMNQAMNRLSSGLRINSAADDAAGSAIASKMVYAIAYQGYIQSYENERGTESNIRSIFGKMMAGFFWPM